MSKHIDLPLSNLAHGAIQEKLDGELVKVFANIHDPNTKAEAKRSITIKLEFEPDENRQAIKLNSDFTTKLANVEGVSTTVLTGKNLTSGTIEAKELKSGARGQTYMDFDEGELRHDTGEPVDVIKKEEDRRNIINLQKGRG
ncbi:replication terminator protein [Salipaludibacillus sp. HK11]|uniref:replication terminator protein n=1 Tax=Salipaludibacillus sp. HK11 TaxID=3394320 RepID=UPI0039FB9E73